MPPAPVIMGLKNQDDNPYFPKSPRRSALESARKYVENPKELLKKLIYIIHEPGHYSEE